MSPSAASEDGPRIGLWGTFDVDNYGDLLFPLITEMELARRLPGARFRVQAPAGVFHPVGLQGAAPAEPLGPWSEERLDALARELDLVVVGGGDIGHVGDVDAYRHPYGLGAEDVRELAPSRFFIDGLGTERERDVPVVWSAVGVPFPFEGSDAERVRRALENRPYLAVRDELSRGHLDAAGLRREIEVVPDPAVLLPRLFPPDLIARTVDYLRVMRWYPREGRPLVIQGGGHLLPWASDLASALARTPGDPPLVLIQTGPCHDDGEFAEALRLYLNRQVHRLPAAVRLRDVAAAIAGAEVFVGSSLLGSLTALAYGRPHVLLDPAGSTKAEGYARMTDAHDRLVRRPDRLPDALETALSGEAPDTVPLQERADAHFDRIASVATGVPAGGAEEEGGPLGRALAAGSRAAGARRDQLQEVLHERAWKLREALLSPPEPSPRRTRPGAIDRVARRLGWARETAAPAGVQAARDERYRRWLRGGLSSPAALRGYLGEAAALGYRPTISVVMPVYNTEPVWLREAIDSVRRQAYPEWELCAADDGSTREATRKLLRAAVREDPRIRVTFLERNLGISAASNAALSMAGGEFVALLDHDDELRPNALLEVVKLLNDARDLDYIYTDEDKKDRDGNFIEPYFKPDWSPELLLSANYPTHLSVFRRKLLEEVGGFREGYEGSQDYDLILRATEATDRIGHVPLPLYSWRQIPGSAAGSVAAKPFAYEAAKRGLADALRRRGEEGEVVEGHGWGHYRVRFRIAGDPKVSIIVPMRDHGDVGGTVVRLDHRSSWANREVLVVPRTQEEAEDVTPFDVRVFSPPRGGPAAAVNEAAAAASGEYLVILHDDTLVIEPAWIEALLEHAQRAGVGVVGTRMCLPDGTPEHEGIVVSPDGEVIRLAERGYFGIDRMVHNRSAVGDACMMVRRDVFQELGGYDETLRGALQGVDLCLRAVEKGYRVVYTPYALVRHGGCAAPERADDLQTFRRRWTGYRDPYYNPNLSFETPYGLASSSDAFT